MLHNLLFIKNDLERHKLAQLFTFCHKSNKVNSLKPSLQKYFCQWAYIIYIAINAELVIRMELAHGFHPEELTMSQTDL